MKFRLPLLLVFTFALISSASATVSTVSGDVFSSVAKEKLIRAQIWFNGDLYSHTDLDGRFEILGATAGDVIRVKKVNYIGTSTVIESENNEFEFQLAPIWKLESAHQIYEDVSEYAWYEPAIRKLYEAQALTATEKQLFKPNENLTRGELAVLGVKVAGFLPKPIGESSFCDVKTEDDFAPTVEFMFSHGWLSGYPSGKCDKGRVFKPHLLANRAEATKMALIVFQDLVNKQVEKNVCLPSGFTDVPDDAWFVEFVDKANCLGFVNGYSDGSFRPANSINRAEIAVILANALESLF